MSDIRYHIEIINGDLTKVVFEDGYTPNQMGCSITEAMRNLCEFRATRQAHDLSVLKHHAYPTPNEPDQEVNPLSKKRRKRWVETETE